MATQRTHCSKGHALVGENIAIKMTGGRVRRQCRECKQAYDRSSAQRRAPDTAMRRRALATWRLRERVLSRTVIDGDCWSWLGKFDAAGRARVRVDGTTRSVARVVYELQAAPVPEGFVLKRTCDHTRCINPDHRRLWNGDAIADRLVAASQDVGECRVWTGRLYHGYGQISIKDKFFRAHRVSYETFVGPIPTGLEIDHLCRNRACIRPAHLEPVTRAENQRRRWAPPRAEAAAQAFPPFDETRCLNGHEWTPETTRVLQRPGRSDRRTCRTCARDETRRRRARQKAAPNTE